MSLRNFQPAIKSAIELAARNVFGHNPVTLSRQGNKLFKTKPLGPLVTNHYIDTKVSEGFFRLMSPSFRTEQQDRRALKMLRLRRRGKGAPKKGQGKRTTKK